MMSGHRTPQAGHLKAFADMHRRVGDHVMDKELIYEKLPADIADRHVLLMDPILATGNSAVKAIQVSSSYVCEDNIKRCHEAII